VQREPGDDHGGGKGAGAVDSHYFDGIDLLIIYFSQYVFAPPRTRICRRSDPAGIRLIEATGAWRSEYGFSPIVWPAWLARL
jgi:hypothetical protein